MTTPHTPTRIAAMGGETLRREIAVNAERIDAANGHMRKLYAVRLAMLKRGRELGITHLVLAGLAGVTEAAVIQQIKKHDTSG